MTIQPIIVSAFINEPAPPKENFTASDITPYTWIVSAFVTPAPMARWRCIRCLKPLPNADPPLGYNPLCLKCGEASIGPPTGNLYNSKTGRMYPPGS